MEGLIISDWDKLLIIQANTTKGPQKFVQKHMVISSANHAVGLIRCIEALKREFGSNFYVATALTQQLKNFVPLKSTYQTERLKELRELCEYIEINISLSDELHIFNTAQGAQKTWLKSPDNLQNSWQSVCDDFRLNNFESCPPFSVFVAFLVKKKSENRAIPFFTKILLLLNESLLPNHRLKLRTSISPNMLNALNQIRRLKRRIYH